MRITFYDISMVGYFHYEFNLAMIHIYKEIYPNAKVRLRGEKNLVKNLGKNLKVESRPFMIFPSKISLYNILLRDFLGVLYVFFYLIFSKKEDKHVFLLVLPFTHWCISVLSFILKRDITICLHGHLDAFSEDSQLGKTRYYYRLEKLLFKLNLGITYIVLGQPIYDSIKSIFSKKSKVLIIDHPCIYDKKIEKNKFDYPLIFAQIGSGDRNKGSQYLFELAEILRQEIKAGLVEFEIIGKLSPNLKNLDRGIVRYSKEILSDHDMDSKIRKCYYTLQLRDHNTSQAVASGSFFDTVKYCKPFLSLNNGFVAYYSRKYGVGEIYMTVSDLADRIRELIKLRDEISKDYSEDVDKMKVMQRALSIKSISEVIKIYEFQ